MNGEGRTASEQGDGVALAMPVRSQCKARPLLALAKPVPPGCRFPAGAVQCRRIAAALTRSTARNGFMNENLTLMIFGASGDLTARNLIPALYQLHCNGYLPGKGVIIGVARREKTDDSFRSEMQAAVREHRKNEYSDEKWKTFAQKLYYAQVDIEADSAAQALRDRVHAIEAEHDLKGERIAYLATAPELFLPSVEALQAAGFVHPMDAVDRLRVVIEKPFGHDLKSAQQLSQQLGKILREKQIYRIDHYLGKETVQNLLLFRFGNAIFEPMFNRNHVDHIQITVAESQGIEGGRGGYYDKSGALRDVLQNHVL